MILERPKLATSACHTALEDQLPLMNDEMSRNDHRRFACRVISFYAPLGNQGMASTHCQKPGFDYTPQQKAPRLIQDLVGPPTFLPKRQPPRQPPTTAP